MIASKYAHESAERTGENAEPAAPARRTEAQRVIELLNQVDLELFNDEYGTAFVRFPVGPNRATAPLRGDGDFSRWQMDYCYRMSGKPPGQRALAEVRLLLEARALGTPPVPVSTRVGALGDTIYLDLGDPTWCGVEIDAAGWRPVADPPVRFRRGQGMLPLPLPQRGGSLDLLRQFINVPDEGTWKLIVGWVVMLLHPTGPYPQLAIHGEQGSGKSGITRLLARLIDPQRVESRAQPRDERDIAVAARNCRVLAYDNLSSISPWLSDAFCRLATGGGFTTRTLYTDDGETLFHSKLPVIYNGINELATQGDLLERALVVTLARIPEERRRTEAELEAAWREVHPLLLGALCDAVSAAMRERHAVQLERLPRMADFARWVTAAEGALGWERGAFLAAYAGNQAEATELSLQGAVIGPPLLALLERQPHWEGTTSELLAALRLEAGEGAQAQGFPRAANRLGGELRRLAPALRARGIAYADRRTNRGTVIAFRKVGPPNERTSAAGA